MTKKTNDKAQLLKKILYRVLSLSEDFATSETKSKHLTKITKTDEKSKTSIIENNNVPTESNILNVEVEMASMSYILKGKQNSTTTAKLTDMTRYDRRTEGPYLVNFEYKPREPNNLQK